VAPTIEQEILIDAPGWATYLARLRDLVGRQRADQAP
jgi:hypothetical protein